MNVRRFLYKVLVILVRF